VPGPPSKLSPEARAEARQRYERGEPLQAIARSLGVDRKVLRRLREREGWAVPVSVPDVGQFSSAVQRRTQAEVISLAARRGVEQAEASGALQQQANTLEDAFALSGALIADFGNGASETVADWRAGRIEIPKTQTSADLALAVGSVVARYASMVREAAGRKPGQPTVEQATESNGPIRIEHRRLETVKVAVDEKGREIVGWRNVEEGEELDREAS
jgi:hypothetical protein